jgi:hypothetical protein
MKLITEEQYLQMIDYIEDEAVARDITGDTLKAVILPPEYFRIIYEYAFESGYALTFWNTPILCAPIFYTDIVFAKSLKEIISIYGGLCGKCNRYLLRGKCPKCEPDEQ